MAMLLQAALVLGGLAWAFNAKPASGQSYRIAGDVPYCDATLMEGPNPQGVSAAAPRGEAVILYDAEAMADKPYLKPFLLARQCAHIVLEHISPQGRMRSDLLIAAMELDADCWAAMALAKAGQGQIVLDQVALFGAEESDRANPSAPTWPARSRKLQDCLLRQEQPVVQGD
ncbi:MAG: hypothetical protein AAGB15_04405 [Pseudomonadota bacterium]